MMPPLTETIEALLWEDESTTLDCKAMQYPFAGAGADVKSEIIKDLLAFANAFRRETAYILLGVTEVKGGRSAITGVANHLEDAHLQQLVNSKTNRTLEFSYHALTLDQKQVGVLRIPRQARPIYLLKDYGKLTAKTVYVRHGSSTGIATLDEIALMGHKPNEERQHPEMTTLQSILHHARFYERIVRLWQNISRIPHHYIVHIARPAEYEQERRTLHVRFNTEYDAFCQAMNSARDLLTEHQRHVRHDDAIAIAEILSALRDVGQTVSALVSWSNSRLDTELPEDKQREAATAADTLSALVAQRLVILGANP